MSGAPEANDNNSQLKTIIWVVHVVLFIVVFAYEASDRQRTIDKVPVYFLDSPGAIESLAKRLDSPMLKRKHGLPPWDTSK